MIAYQKHYINYQYKPSESYFFLETQPIAKPIDSGLYEKDNEIVNYAEFANGDLTSAELHKDDIWKGRYIPNDTKSVTRVYEGSFLFVSRHSLYNSYGPAYDARHSKMGFKRFQSYYPKPYSEVNIKPEPPQFLENNSIWENDPKYYIYLDSLDVPRILSILGQWPTEKKRNDKEESVWESIVDQARLDFDVLGGLSYEELLELVCIMYLGRDTYGKRITSDIWNLHLKYMRNESYEKLTIIIKGKPPSTTKDYIYQGLRSLSAGQTDY